MAANVKLKKKLDPQVTYEADAECPSTARTDVTIRGLVDTVDEPEERGGTNTAPSPIEAIMTALAGCTNVTANRIAEHLGVEFKDMKIHVELDFDRRSALMIEEIDLVFPEVRLDITVTTDAPDEKIEKVKDGLPRYCSVSKMLSQAGTNVVNTWTVNRP